MFCSRFVSFISSLENSSKICIRLLINLLKFDQRSVTAKNLRNIADKCNKDLNIIDKRIVKDCMIFQEIPVEEEWRIPFLNKLFSAKTIRLLSMALTKLRLTILLILYARPNYSMILFLVFVFIFDIYS